MKGYKLMDPARLRRGDTSIYLHKSGTWLDFADPQPESIHLADIRQALCWERRYGNNSFTVARHSVIVALLLEDWGADRATVRAGFVHDFSEAYLRDVPSPGKVAMRRDGIWSDYDETEYLLSDAIDDRFGITNTKLRSDAVHTADMEARRLEVLECFGEDVAYEVYGITDLTPNHSVLLRARDLGFDGACERWGIV